MTENTGNEAQFLAGLAAGMDAVRKRYPDARTIGDLIQADRLERIAAGTWEPPEAPVTQISVSCDVCLSPIGTFELMASRAEMDAVQHKPLEEPWRWRPAAAEAPGVDYLFEENVVSNQSMATIRDGMANGSVARRRFDLRCECNQGRNVPLRDDTAMALLNHAVSEGLSVISLRVVEAVVNRRADDVASD